MIFDIEALEDLAYQDYLRDSELSIDTLQLLYDSNIIGND